MTALPTSGSFVMVDPTHVAAVGAPAALLFARIVWRSQEAGCWRASRDLLSRETGLSLDVIRTALRVLREREWVLGERASADDATLVWSPVLAGQPDIGDSPRACGESPQLPDVGTSPISSLETVETPTPYSPPDSEQAALPLLVLVPDPPSEAAVEVAADGPAKTAQTLVARWVDGYRSVNGGQDPHQAVIRPVAGQARNLAKACGDDHEAWVDAWHATYNAGVAGSRDLVRYLVPQQQRRQPTGRAGSNAFAAPAMGGPDAATMERFSSLLGGQQHRALGGGA